jgi:hypothetical protein
MRSAAVIKIHINKLLHPKFQSENHLEARIHLLDPRQSLHRSKTRHKEELGEERAEAATATTRSEIGSG